MIMLEVLQLSKHDIHGHSVSTVPNLKKDALFKMVQTGMKEMLLALTFGAM